MHHGQRPANWTAQFEPEIWCKGPSTCVGCEYLCVTRRKQQRPGIAKNDKTTAQSKPPTKQPSHTQTANEQHYKPVHQTSDAPHTSVSTPPPLTHKTQRTSSVSRKRPTLIQGQNKVSTTTQHPYCTHPCRHVKPSTITSACTQHRRQAEHSQKACMVQKANEQGTPPPLYREGTVAARRPGERGGGVVAGGGPQNTSKGAQRGRR